MNISIIGTGLIGTSLASILAKHHNVVGYDNNPEHVHQARQLKIFHAVYDIEMIENHLYRSCAASSSLPSSVSSCSQYALRHSRVGGNPESLAFSGSSAFAEDDDKSYAEDNGREDANHEVVFENSNIPGSLSNADVIIFAVPVLAFEHCLKAIAAHIGKNVVLTDVLSVKQYVVNAAKKILKNRALQFIPGHPIAGAEHSGPKAFDPLLFEDRQVILTPWSDDQNEYMDVVKNLWESTGARVSILSPESHDEILSRTSHLPQMLSYAYMQCFEGRKDFKTYSAGAFRDFTRIAKSSPVMWRDICVTNKSQMLSALKDFQSHLGNIQAMIEEDKVDELEEYFQRSRELHPEYEA
ncbi:MAG: prephenate dehydrogenase [Gammaproteobacteria bacterium]